MFKLWPTSLRLVHTPNGPPNASNRPHWRNPVDRCFLPNGLSSSTANSETPNQERRHVR
jgi:hypothetical protein